MLVPGPVYRFLLLVLRLLLLARFIIGRLLLFFLLVSLGQPVWKLAESRRAIQRSFYWWQVHVAFLLFAPGVSCPTSALSSLSCQFGAGAAHNIFPISSSYSSFLIKIKSL